MARHHLHLLPLLCLVTLVATTDGHGSLDFRADLAHPYAGSSGGGSLSRHEAFRRAARASKARAARIASRLARVLGRGDISAADVPLAPLSDQGHSLTVGIGTPPQPRTLIVDTGSDLIWTQCKLFRRTAKQREPLYDPASSSSFSFLSCGSRLCQEGQFGFKNCSEKNRCVYDDVYGSAEAGGVLASETFTFGGNGKVKASVPLGFGCGALSAGSLVGASGIMGLSPGTLSLISQLSIPKFSYCLTPFAERKTSPLLFGAMADLHKYKTTGPVQTTSILRNPVETAYYYVPLVALSLGTKRLKVPASSLAINPDDGTGGTIVDSGSTIAYLVDPAFEAVRKAVVEAVRLPVANETVEDYELCFALPRGTAMADVVRAPPLVLHFDGGARMVLPRDNYFQEPTEGLMCLAVGATPLGLGVSIIGNVQQQNMHVLFDVRNQKFSFAPTKCDEM